MLSAGLIFSSCAANMLRVQPEAEGVTLILDLKTCAHDVRVIGDFNQWDPEKGTMKCEDGLWTVGLPLQRGLYHYVFLVDGEIFVPPDQKTVPDAFGGRNLILRLEQ